MMRQGLVRACQRLVGEASRQSRPFVSAGRATAGALTRLPKQNLSGSGRAESSSEGGWASRWWLLPAAAAAALATAEPVQALEVERSFIMVKPDGVQRGLIADIIARYEQKGYKLVAIKMVTPTKAHAQKHYHDLKDRPFFNGLCDFLSSGPVIAMVWEGPGVITYGRKIIGATSPLASEPGTVRGDYAISVGRNVIHGSDGPQGAIDEIKLWFKPEELNNYKRDTDKWLYE